jgi:hypothetical protein
MGDAECRSRRPLTAFGGRSKLLTGHTGPITGGVCLMSKIVAALLLSAAVVLPSLAYAGGPAELNTGQCVKAMNDARKAGGNQANGQNNTTPRSGQIQDIKASLAEFGTCTPPPPPTCVPSPGVDCGVPSDNP